MNKMNSSQITSLVLTGYFDKVEDIRHKVDSVPYENFPYCCSNKQVTRVEVNMVPKRQKPAHFWTQDIISRYSNIRSNYRPFAYTKELGDDERHDPRNPRDGGKNNNQHICQKYEQIKDFQQSEANKEYYESIKIPNNPDIITYDQFQDILQQINYDIAWQIFDEVNEHNNIEQIIDLNCLDIYDGIALTKQKIYDLAESIAQNGTMGRMLDHEFRQFDNDLILIVVCADEHIQQVKDEYTGRSPLKNCILEMVRNEL